MLPPLRLPVTLFSFETLCCDWFIQLPQNVPAIGDIRTISSRCEDKFSGFDSLAIEDESLKTGNSSIKRLDGINIFYQEDITSIYRNIVSGIHGVWALECNGAPPPS